ncbi:hypothetical protein COO60DRAFT_1210854 [Scenedesmus sp. NREL 46B-D3]|nr:hypothetical protein COO60DRAFT_1210854 [Scenedesmus sp. NREL 46B-D3]
MSQSTHKHRPAAAGQLGTTHGRPGAASPTAGSSGSRQRTFRDKFHSMLQEAQEANIQAVHKQELQDRRSLSVAMLMQGRPHAFVDFFMLSQQQYGSAPGAGDSAAAAAGNEAVAGSMGSSNDLSLQSLILLQQQLVVADAASKAGQHEQAFAAHAHMARHFTQLGMLDKSVFFWKKCLQVSVSAAWGPGELESSCALGLLYESLHQPHLAMACHERCLQLALQLQRQDDAATAHAQLVQVYAQQAEQCSREGDPQGAAAYYSKCADAALQCGDAASAGAACHHLGLIDQQQGSWQTAMDHQRAYMQLSRQAGDQKAEGRACVAYAECQQQLGQLAGAVESLETYLELSRSQDPRGQATACCKLGVLYQQQGELEQAVDYFERFFELARSLGERRLLDVARINLGAARSARRLPEYKQLCWDNLDSLLAWKCTRQAF